MRAERFNHDFTTDELVDVAGMTRELSRQAEITQVIFNNNYEDQGQRNAREMIDLLSARRSRSAPKTIGDDRPLTQAAVSASFFSRPMPRSKSELRRARSVH